MNVLPDSERIAQLEAALATVQKRLDALEASEAQRSAHEITTSPAVNDYLRTQIFGAIAGSQDDASLNHFQ